MDRLWQWVWDRYGPWYGWVGLAITFLIVLPVTGTAACVVVAFEDSDRYPLGVAVVAAGTLMGLLVGVRPGSADWRRLHGWAAGKPIGRMESLEATYRLARGTVVWGTATFAVVGSATTTAVAAVSGASTPRLAEWAILGAVHWTSIAVIAVHSYIETALRPVRSAIIADTTIGDALPRSRPSFATWSNVTLMATAWSFTLVGALSAVVIGSAATHPNTAVLIATGMTVLFAVPITLGSTIAPSWRPIRDLAEGTARVAAGDYGQRLAVVQDDDLGVLIASFNRMQAGLAERQRLHAAFGSYVDPILATRLLDQGDELFSGERRVVTVMFVDIRDFTPFAESHTAEETVAHLNAVFGIIVPAVVEAGGHVNKYLGDGALAVFGAPDNLTEHADAALAAASRICEKVTEQFGGATRIGIGINTGPVIAGTIGGGGKLEFTLIGDTVNVAARVEQLTKTTGDSILMTEHTIEVLVEKPSRLLDRGAHALKGKAASSRIFALGVDESSVSS